MKIDILAFVEDPGAANWFVPLMPALAEAGLGTALFADGFAAPYLHDRQIAHARPGAQDENTLLDQHEPRAVLVGTSENLDTLGLRLVTAARARGIPTLAVVDQPANAEHRFRGQSQDPLRFAPDFLLLPDAGSAEAFTRLGVASERLRVIGNIHWDRVRAAADALDAADRQEVRRQLFSPDAERTIIVFLAEIGYVVNPEAAIWEANLNFSGRGTTRSRTAIVLEEVIDAISDLKPRPWLVLRLHPKNSPDEFAGYAHEIDQVSAGGDPLSLIWAADLTIGMTSSLVEEAFVMGRPVISILPHDAERDWLRSVSNGDIPAAVTRAELRRLLRDILGAPPAARSPRPQPGCATAAAVHEIQRIMNAPRAR